MNLFLLRHGRAAERDSAMWPDDSLRPLSAGGERKVRRAADGMRRLRLPIGLIVTSPLIRARCTAQIAAERLSLPDILKTHDQLAPGGKAAGLIADLNALEPRPEGVLLVGHQPDLGELLALLTSGRRSVDIDFPKGGLARLKVATGLKAGRCATLKWLLTARQLARLA